MDGDGSQRDALLRDARDQNSRLQQLIDITAQLVAHSRQLLQRLRGEVKPPTDTNQPGT